MRGIPLSQSREQRNKTLPLVYLNNFRCSFPLSVVFLSLLFGLLGGADVQLLSSQRSFELLWVGFFWCLFMGCRICLFTMLIKQNNPPKYLCYLEQSFS